MLFHYTTNALFAPTPDPTTLEILAQNGIFPAEEHPHSIKGRYRFNCPFHADSDPSLSVHTDGKRWKCWAGCGKGGPRRMRELLSGDVIPQPLPQTPKPVVKKIKERPPSDCSLNQLAEAKPLPVDFLQSVMGWFDTRWHSVGIDYGNGNVRYRTALTGKHRFKWRTGSLPSLYWVDHLPEDAESVLVVEGETDTAAGTFLDVATVGVPGVDTWKPEWAGLLAGKDVVLWVEPDHGGETLAKKMAQDIPHLRVIQAPDGIKDICELLDQAGSGAGELLRELMAEAETYWPADGNVASKERYKNNKFSFLRSDKCRKSLLWGDAKKHFPFPAGVKPWLVERVLYNHTAQKAMVTNFLSNSWRNPVNAQFKRQCLYYNLLPRINGRQFYQKLMPFDDWSQRKHQSLTRRLQRALKKAPDIDLGYLWFDNAMMKGYFIYITNVPGLPGFEPVENVETTLVDGLKGIHPPEKESPGRFHGYGGSDNWTSKAEGTGERDEGKWKIIAVSDKPADFVGWEAEAVASNIHHETKKPYWRIQYGDGLEMNIDFKEAVEIALSLGLALTLAGKAASEGSLNNKEEAKEWHESKSLSLP